MKTRSSNGPKLQNKPKQSLQGTQVIEHPKDEISQVDRRRRAVLLARIYETILSWDEEADTPNNPSSAKPGASSGMDGDEQGN